MQLTGRRVYIAGSANERTPPGDIEYGHRIIADLTDGLLREGASVAVGVGKEPRYDDPDPSSPALVFDWTVLERVGAHLANGGDPKTNQGPLVATVASSKTESQIPEHRRALWTQLKDAGAVHITFLDEGRFSGTTRRQRLARLGDLLVALSGGEGVEQLAEVFVEMGKPVIPLSLNLGASTNDGAGGSARLYRRALASPRDFFRVTDPTQAATLLSNLDTPGPSRPPADIAAAILRLAVAVEAPRAFFVRLLNQEVPEYGAVERFFTNVVVPVTKDFGYEPFETGRNPNEYAWMNNEIFDALHYSSVAIIDVTGLRNNCFLELGYALGRELRTIVTAMKGTRPPFDSTMIPHHFWEDGVDDSERRTSLAEFWDRNIRRPPLVLPRTVL